VGKGAPPENIEIFAMGAENPVASNETAEGRRLNRRVEIDFQTGNETTN
jgi:general secretion pathway protein A